MDDTQNISLPRKESHSNFCERMINLLITTMLADLPNDQFTSFWIGANEGAATEGIWWWSDESKWDFTNWAQGQPDDWNSVSRIDKMTYLYSKIRRFSQKIAFESIPKITKDKKLEKS